MNKLTFFTRAASLLAPLAALHAADLHVAITGSDASPGTPAAPLRTIQRAADLAQPGDTVTVHAGVYREHVNPPRGGRSDSTRIIYQAAQGEEVIITGSESAKGWVRDSGDTWKLTLPASYFGKFNPFEKSVQGDWFDPRGRVHHLGMVYLNGHWLAEAVSVEEVLKPMTATPLWFASVDITSTVIRAQFQGVDPNASDVEIAKRYTVFTPEKTNIDYITVRGFKLKNAASNWAAPTSGQHGLVTAYWCKGWLIEDNEISYSRCCGIALGKYSDEWDNRRGDKEGYDGTIADALKTGGWHKDKIGGHIVRRNHIHHCGQTGIVGSLGCAFSRVENNEIHDINKQGIWDGAEMAGIKFHAAIDVVISGNHIYRCGELGGLWLDWMAQGTHVTGNLLHENDGHDIFTEVNHGPFVIANNIMLSEGAYLSNSQGGTHAHNLVAGRITIDNDSRQTPYHKAHSTEIAGRRDCPVGDVRWYNNLLAGTCNLNACDQAVLPVAAAGNVFTKGAQSSRFDEAALLKPDFEPGITLTRQDDGWYLELKVDKAWAAEQKRRVVGTEMLGKAVIPDLPFDNADGSPLKIDTDYFGRKRETTNPFPGPFEVKEGGKQKIKVWPRDELARSFQQPPESARTGVFWFWVNGNITRVGITADLEAMARVGIRTVHIFETSGDIPDGPVKFLSDEWRALFKHALDEAARLGLKLNINNDAGWCGSGGPWNTPENSMQKLVSTRTSVEGGKPFDAVLPQPPAVKEFYRDIVVLATKALPSGDDKKRIWPLAHAVDLTSRTDASGRLRWDPPAGTWDILRIGHTSTGKDNHPAPASGCGPECDKLSKTAVKAHFDGMMAKLIRDAGPLAGKTLEYTHIDSWEVGFQNWTPAFRTEFQRLRGYDPLPFLPGELEYIVADAETNRRFQWDMRMTVSDLMLENYAGYFRELAAAHGLKLSIEAYGAHPGNCPANNLSYAGRADLPIGEFWVGHNNYRSCKEMASASHVYGKRLAGAEAFTAWPDNARRQFHPGNIKAMGDQCFCAGVNRLMLHCSTHQPWLDRAPGMTMQGWGTHFDRTETWWEQSKAWHDYLARCQHLLQSGLFAADVCYLDVEDAPRDAPYPVKLPGYDYDVCPAEVVKTRMSVKDGRITLPDGMSYRLLVLPPTDRMTPETLRKVVELAKAGATLAATTLPSQSPSLQNHPKCDAEVKALARELFGELVAAAPATGIRESRCGAGKVLLGGDVTQALTALGIQPDITFTDTDKPETFRWIHRRTDTAEFYFLSNQLAEEKQVTCTFRVAGAQPELWHPETGRITRLPVHKSTADGRIDLPLKFGPDEAFFVVFPKSRTAIASAGTPSGNWPEFQAAMTLEGPWQVTFDPKWGGPEKPVRFETLADWSRHAKDGIKFYSGAAVYQKTFSVEPAVAGLPSVFLDLGQVEIMADVKLNGKELGTLWKKPFRIDVTGHLKPGDNQLELRVVNLWCNRLIGDEHLPEEVEWKDGFMGWGGPFDLISRWPQWLLDGKPGPGGRFTFTTARYYKKDDPLKPSGLLGPVRILMPQ